MANTSATSFALPSSCSHSHMCPRLFIQMSGAPGSGKSTTAGLLAKEIDAHIIDHDIIKSAILEDNVPFEIAGKLAYSVDWAIAENIIKQERSVIIDSTCNYQETINRGYELALKYGFTYWYIEIRADADNLELLDKRLQARASLRSQRTSVDNCPSDVKPDLNARNDGREIFKHWILNPCRPDNNIIIVNSEGQLEERIQYILARFSAAWELSIPRKSQSVFSPFKACPGALSFPPDLQLATEIPSLFSGELISPKVKGELPEGYQIRPLRKSDYERGYLETLGDLTDVGEFTHKQFIDHFDLMTQLKNTYYILVIEETRTGRVIATGSLFVELKFIHGLSKAAHLEDIVVANNHRGKHLGSLIHNAIEYIIKQTGCYKAVLDCRDYNVGFHEKAGYTQTGAYMKKRYDEVPVAAYGTIQPGE